MRSIIAALRPWACTRPPPRGQALWPIALVVVATPLVAGHAAARQEKMACQLLFVVEELEEQFPNAAARHLM